MAPIILICCALIIMLTLGLAFWTSIQRGLSREVYHCAVLDPASGMAKAQRAHGNAAEYAGVLIGLFLITGFAYQGRDLGMTVTGLVVAITLARFIQAIGLLTCKTLERIHPLKVIGSSLTYVCGLALAIMVIVRAL